MYALPGHKPMTSFSESAESAGTKSPRKQQPFLQAPTVWGCPRVIPPCWGTQKPTLDRSNVSHSWCLYSTAFSCEMTPRHFRADPQISPPLTLLVLCVSLGSSVTSRPAPSSSPCKSRCSSIQPPKHSRFYRQNRQQLCRLKPSNHLQVTTQPHVRGSSSGIQPRRPRPRIYPVGRATICIISPFWRA